MMRALFFLFCACAGAVPPNTQRCPTRPPLGLGFAVTHVAPVQPGVMEGQLMLGALAAQRMGAHTLKIYLTPNYREKYRETWDDVRSLKELANTPQMRAVLAMPFRTFVLTTYTFANGVDGGFLDGFDELEAKAEYHELRAFAEWLIEHFRGTDKRFVLQNWEGDWAARGGFDKDKPTSRDVLAGMRAYITARQEAIAAARADKREDRVRIDHAVEVNVLLGNGPSVADDVLPGVCVDAVSYSAWEALAPLYTPAPDAIERSASNLARAVAHLRARAGNARVYLGELGVAENDLPAGRHARDVVPALVRATDADIVWWQVFDNECPDGRCRGHGLLRPDGKPSSVLQALRKL